MKSATVCKNGRDSHRRASFRARSIKPGSSIITLAVAACFGTGGAYANPTNPAVVNGNVQFTTAGNLLTVTNNSNKAIINWGSFSIGANEITRFVQQSASSAVLNRVVGQDPSQILGALQSNGRVFLINPNGILFGAGSQINVAGLVASTMNLSNEDFLAGRMRFTGGLGNSVINQGNIKTEGTGGNVYLIGNAVTNNGIITSPKGEVVLAAGNSVELVNPGTPDLRVEVVAPTNQAVNLKTIVADSGRVGIYAGLINQAGTINANSVVLGENGQIILRATKNIDLAAGSVTTANGTASASGTSGGSVNIEAGALLSAAGTIEARSATGVGGNVLLKADVLMQTGAVLADGASGGSISMQARNLQSAGRINADGTAGAGGQVDLQATNSLVQTTASRVSADGAAGDGGSVTLQGASHVFSSTSASATGTGTTSKGGTVKVLGNEIVLRGATLDASGDAGGGTVLVGGDRHGQNPAVPNAKNTSVNFASTLRADAKLNGDGGKVVVWADGNTVFNGQASARGGAQGGNGGFIELSGKEKINFGGFATAGAPKGKAGMLQLDPMNIIIDSTGSVGAYSTIDLADPNPGMNEGFGRSYTVLPNGNIIALDANDSFVASNAGAVYLFNGTTGALISSLTGLSANDFVGSYGVTVLTNGNYVIQSTDWHNGAAAFAGAVTFGLASTGVSGVVSAANSLVGSTTNDRIGYFGVIPLTNGNYVVNSPDWTNGGASSAGAVTFGSGTTGVSGLVSSANSLVGTSTNDFVGLGGITALPNGNYVVNSYEWNNGVATKAGAVTFGSGTTGISGAVTALNSLVGSTTDDRVGEFGITALSNDNYVVRSAKWNNGAATAAGAVTWGSGTAGVSGVVSAANSLVGTTANDAVGEGLIALSNGNYVVTSLQWNNGAATQAGAVTFGSGTTGVSGAVSAANSLVGTTTGDRVGEGAIQLTNGNYVVISKNWDNGGIMDAGAVTFGSGTTGIAGAVSAANSLVGTTANDQVGLGGVTALTNGNYVVRSQNWANGAATSAGAVTWGSGTTGVSGAVYAANSLVGTTAFDFVGLDDVTVLSNSNYVVRSSLWNNGAATSAGAVTWGSGTTGVSGVVSAANSLVGTTTNDRVGGFGVTALPNGNYVVNSPDWANGAATQAGAVTFGNGTTGIAGAVSAANSLVGSTSGDFVGDGGISILANGNYVVSSLVWNNGPVTHAGAVTWGSSSVGVKGVVSVANSLVGVTDFDQVGATFPDGAARNITPLANGNFLVGSEAYTNVGLSLPNAGKLQIYVPGGLNNPLAFSDSAASTVTITPSQITDITNTGTAIVLQANNDITLNAASDIITVPVSANGGDITMQAGRSVFLNSNITSANGNVTIVANETAANGVFDAHRSVGTAGIFMAPGTTINSGAGNISLTLSTGAGLTNNQSGTIQIANLTTTTGSVSVVNTGSVAGGGPIDMVVTPAAITSPLITLHGSAIGTTSGHVHLDPGADSVFATANTGGIYLEQIAGTLNTSQYSFSAPAGQEVRLESSGGNININNSLTLAGENLVLRT